MTNIAKRAPESQSIRTLTRKVARSSLIFVGLSAVICWILYVLDITFRMESVTIYSLGVTLASALARYCFQFTHTNSEFKTFTMQILYLCFVIFAGLNFGYIWACILPPGECGHPFAISIIAVFATFIVDSLYNFLLDGTSQSLHNNLIGECSEEKIGRYDKK